MLDERRALSFSYDADADIARITFEHTLQHATSTTFPAATKAVLLLDAAGFLVGVDFGDDRGARAVVMLGPHEKVDSQRKASVLLSRVGNADGYEVQISGAKAAVRANDTNPYIVVP